MKCHIKFQRFHFFWILLKARNKANLNNVECYISSFATILKYKFIGQIYIYIYIYFSFHNTTSRRGSGSAHGRDFPLTLNTKHSLGLLPTRDNLVADTSTLQNTSLTRYTHAPWRDSNPKHHQACGRITTLRSRFKWDRR